MVIVVAPAEAELVLAAFLDLGGPIARFPIGAFGVEEKLAGEIAPDQLEALIEDLTGDAEAVGIVGETTGASVPEFLGPNDAAEMSGVQWSRDKAAIGMALDGFEASAVFF